MDGSPHPTHFHGFSGGPAPGGVQFMALEVQLLFMEGWLVESEVVLAKSEWLKHLTRPTKDLQKSSQLCF